MFVNRFEAEQAIPVPSGTVHLKRRRGIFCLFMSRCFTMIMCEHNFIISNLFFVCQNNRASWGNRSQKGATWCRRDPERFGKAFAAHSIPGWVRKNESGREAEIPWGAIHHAFCVSNIEWRFVDPLKICNLPNRLSSRCDAFLRISSWVSLTFFQIVFRLHLLVHYDPYKMSRRNRKNSERAKPIVINAHFLATQ